MFVLVYWNEDADSKRFKAKRSYLLKGIIDNYNVIINSKSFYDEKSNPKAIQQLEFVRKFKKLNKNDNNCESMFVLTILEKIKETRLKFSQGSVTLL